MGICYSRNASSSVGNRNQLKHAHVQYNERNSATCTQAEAEEAEENEYVFVLTDREEMDKEIEEEIERAKKEEREFVLVRKPAESARVLYDESARSSIEDRSIDEKGSIDEKDDACADDVDCVSRSSASKKNKNTTELNTRFNSRTENENRKSNSVSTEKEEFVGARRGRSTSVTVGTNTPSTSSNNSNSNNQRTRREESPNYNQFRARRQNSFSRLSPHPSPRTQQSQTNNCGIVSTTPKHKRMSSRGSWHDGMSNFSDENGMRNFFGAPVSSGPPRNWTIGDHLGEGSYGKVSLALNGETGELFALKLVKIAGIDDDDNNNNNTNGQDPRFCESVVQLEQEVHMLSQLTHPNIVRYIGISRQEDILNVFMEYVPGGSIASLLQRFGPLGDSVTRVYTRQILIGLDYLHSQRVVHRDIKGANILVEKSGRIKLADFGMAKMLEFVDVERNASAKKAVKGSAYWMAPEVIRKSEVTLGCDVWSVGCTVIEMASAKPPWCECSTQVQAMYKIASSNQLPTLPEQNLSKEAKAFILHCLKRNVEERPDVETLLADPFVDDSQNDTLSRVPALRYEQHDGSYSNFPDTQSLVSSHVNSLEDPSEETDVEDDDDDEKSDIGSGYGGDDTDIDESLHDGNAFISKSPAGESGLDTGPSVLGTRRKIALSPLVVNSTRTRDQKNTSTSQSRTGSASANVDL